MSDKNTTTDVQKAEMSFVDHLEALRWHIVRSVLVLFVGAVFAFIYITEIFDHIILAPTKKEFVSYRLLCQLGKWLHTEKLCMNDVAISFQNTELSGQFMMSFSSAFVFGFIIAFPYIIWEVWRFIKPGLTAREQKYSKGMISSVSLLFFIGVAFGYYIITPYTVNFFATYKISNSFQNIIKIDDYLSTVINLVLGTGLIFELPIFIYFLSKIGVITPAFMREYRKYAIVFILVLAAVITPPDVFSQVIVTIPIWILYELSIIISARVQKERRKKEIDFFSN
ncbi:MAG: twin-arginine translocase subunit TatC [Chitinophagaceae bacterium]